MTDSIDFAPLLEKIVSFIDEGVLITDNKGNVLYQNPAAGKLLGQPDSTPIQKLKDIGQFNLQRAILRAAIDNGEVDAAGRPSGHFISFEQQLKHQDSYRQLEITSGLVELDQEMERKRLILIRDRTDQRHIEAVFNTSGTSHTTQDPRMLEIIQRIRQIAPSNAFMLLQGESGTGKTQLVRMIHNLSNRSNGPFVEVNCAAIPETLIESELFGHVKGAFTGAISDRSGRFQSAHQGTLFLDEVAEIPMHLQAKLLRAIQEQQFEMVGSDKSIRVDVRIIAASNRNLREMVDDGEFRADLYYRLAVIPITIPSLRERPGDIPLLIKHFCKQMAARGYPDNMKCSPDAMRIMMDYPWPGNVRELENAVEHGLICAVNDHVEAESLPQDIRDYVQGRVNALNQAQSEVNHQEQQIRKILKITGGNKAEAAKRLGIDRSTLWRRMQKHGITA